MRDLKDLTADIARRVPGRPEAELQADIREFLLRSGLNLSDTQVLDVNMETQLGDATRRRIDVEVGNLVIEVKRDLLQAGVREEAIEQLAGYVASRTQKMKSRYVGVLTDGRLWSLFYLDGEELEEIANLELVGPPEGDLENLRVWLETILATVRDIAPVPEEIHRRLGASSNSHKLDHATLASLLHASQSPDVELKRQLWATLLRTAFGANFVDDERLFIDHTLLVLSAEIIAHAALGFDVSDPSLTPEALVRGDAFADTLIYGVVEQDFFDWVLDVEGGRSFVASLARRLWRFDWASVEHDVLKVLYESVIQPEERRKLGEYYTPDWLADRTVEKVQGENLEQRLLDPSCGSGTFLFHAIKNYLAHATEAGLSCEDTLSGLTSRIIGIDVHPVAVTLARVTYLLAIGSGLLNDDERPAIAIPVYLGDSVQWDQRTDILGSDKVNVPTAGDDLVDTGQGALFGDALEFPRSIIADARSFDLLVNEMAERVQKYDGKGDYPRLAPLIRKYGVHEADVEMLTATFHTWCQLQARGRNHIWGYYVRNLIRPLWLTEPANKVDALVGNPPWLRYNNMHSNMQQRYKEMSKDRGLLQGGLGASARDLSSFFVVRCVELYLEEEGRFAFLMPRAALSRKPYSGFRSGRWASSQAGLLAARFDTAWDLDGVVPNIFPVPAAMVSGTYSPNRPRRLSSEVLVWSGRLPAVAVSWKDAEDHLSITPGDISSTTQGDLDSGSKYRTRFRDGAILYPRYLLFVEDAPSGPFGAGKGRKKVHSRRSVQEKEPWKLQPSLTGTVERRFVFKVHLGETIAPFRALEPLAAVLPLRNDKIMDRTQIEDYAGLNTWWEEVEAAWKANRAKTELNDLVDRMDYHKQLSSQLPAPSNRVVYSKAGNSLSAARVSDSECIIDHKLYWAAASSAEEAHYLVAILNSQALLERVAPLQSKGLFGPRDFDKNVFRVAIPIFSPLDEDHIELARVSAEAEELAFHVEINDKLTFQANRRKVREALTEAGLDEQIENLVRRVVPFPAT
ncbi:N-6 DNA methylase [Actinomycetospora straminea]|uniref:site-specific DNA-methyltransferase (adenine-specific) n=1 Tax=Actinomycetospora straminea TaxID=663607 RepID=A0ABP9EBX0_9PSEU|nr:N-6 DNA methylase [Actinomycetospora straminea]MDD7931924.1 N-6 DNA methylase [Actinomycetospora straminea]